MRIPIFWAKGRYEGKNTEGTVYVMEVWGSSNRSQSEAKYEADRRARRAFDIVVTQGKNPDEYDYADAPIREEILERIMLDGKELALITRNRYGARVLNCAEVFFADVDVAIPPATGFLNRLKESFGGGRQAREERKTGAARAVEQRIGAWAARNPERSFRLYRTCAGFRLLFTDKLHQPNADETMRVLQELQSDPLYIRLTRKQECFRARLSAKPWRCGCKRPPRGAFPHPDAKTEQAFRAWLQGYEQREAQLRVCALAGAYGRAQSVPALDRIVELHDRAVRITSEGAALA
jgi:hypothetical protein